MDISYDIIDALYERVKKLEKEVEILKSKNDENSSRLNYIDKQQ